MENKSESYDFPAKKHLLQSLERIVFGLNETNFKETIQSVIDLYDDSFPYSFQTIINRLIYSSFLSQRKDAKMYFLFLKEIEMKLKNFNHDFPKYFDSFVYFIMNLTTQESYYLLEKMIEEKLIEPKLIKKSEVYFLHHMSEEEINNTKDSCVAILRRKGQFVPNIQDLSKDNWKNHIKCIQEGVNPTKITIALRNDDLEMLQDITSQNNFNFNQKIEPSLYEMCSFVNNVGVSLIDYSAFFGSVKCFKFLLLNGSNSLNTGRFAVAGGNLEIIHLCEQNSSSFSKSYEAAIEFHHNNIFYYLYDNKIININNNELNELGIKCIQCNNFEILSFLEEIGMKINNSLINESARNGNIYLVKHFIEIGQIPKDILIDSVNSGNIELIKYILSQKGININAKNNLSYTALMQACKIGRNDIIKLLLEQKGIDINAKNNWGQTALICACQNNIVDNVKLLLSHKEIDMHANDNWGSTALMHATKKSYKEIVDILLEQEGIEVDKSISRCDS